ncbi:MAG: DUF3071 domain-containing protein [Bifidobacteriaceae bacterium]|jgi:hypothetical protein|nr:DUF3071 domain-containing protein [Bifidobacteriaceae bacterium]
MKKELSTAQIQKLLREGVSQSELKADYEVDEKLLESFAKMVNIEKQFAIEELKSYNILHDDTYTKFGTLISGSAAKYGDYGIKPIYLATKTSREPWNIEISLSTHIVLKFSWNPANYELKPLNDYSAELLEKGFIEPKTKVANPESEAEIIEIAEAIDKVTDEELIDENDIMPDYNPFASEDIETDNQALTEIIDLTEVRQEDSKPEPKLEELIEKPKSEKPKEEASRQEKPEEKKTKKEEKQKRDNSTTSIEDAEIGKGKAKKTPSERIPVPSWDDIILGGK